MYILKWLAKSHANRILFRMFFGYVCKFVSFSFMHALNECIFFFCLITLFEKHIYIHGIVVYVHLLFLRWPWHSVSTRTLQFVSSFFPKTNETILLYEHIKCDNSSTYIWFAPHTQFDFPINIVYNRLYICYAAKRFVYNNLYINMN